jgi:hypothetical protein
MPALEGWMKYQFFAESVRDHLRYVREEAANALLADVLSSCGSRVRLIPKGTVYWRARLGSVSEWIRHEDVPGDGNGSAIEVIVEQSKPFPVDQMKPIKNWSSDGRANPRGIPCLYMATDKETAMAEVRPWIGSSISVAQCETARDLKVVDCSVNHDSQNLVKLADLKGPTAREEGMWIAIDRAFATPVTREDDVADYVPTQIISELFKSSGYDGIVYKSLLSKDGFNVSLFDIELANVTSCSLSKVNSISFEFGDDA